MPPRKKKTSAPPQANDYRHAEQALARPDVGTQPQFKKRAAPRTYRYDSSLSPALAWDGQNAARERGEALIREILDAETIDAAKAAAAKLEALSRPFLDWAGKAERLSFDVPTLPLFVHERLSTRAILETLKGHRSDKQLGLFELFADPQRPIHEQVLRAYEYTDDWVNRMILGDSLVAMNSLLHYESLGGQVQMIYMDPPYGVKFGSNFQPFVRKRDVAHNDDEDMTREPEMVQAYRDTWEVGLHSYLTYLRDRLLLCRDLLAPSGSVFVQISDENLHHVREVMDEVFGSENALPLIVFRKTTGAGSPSGYVEAVPQTCDFLLWYAKDRDRAKLRRLFTAKDYAADENFRWVEESSGTRRAIRPGEEPTNLAEGVRLFRPNPLTSQTGGPTTRFEISVDGKVFVPKKGGWKTNAGGIERLRSAGRLIVVGNTLCFLRYATDFPFQPVIDIWDDTRQSGFGQEKLYVVQTASTVVERCLLLTTDPGDLVLDPTCGSGTTAYVAEQWGRRWITIDTSRVPLALARQRLLTATYPWYDLKDEPRGPAGGFVYRRKQNQKGEEVGGIVPHVTLKSIANDEPPVEEVLVDRPEEAKGITRVTGPFVLEATIPTVSSLEDETPKPGTPSPAVTEEADFVDRMLEILRHSPALRLEGNRTLTLRNVRRPAKTLSLSAEAMVGEPPNGKTESLAAAVGRSDEENRISLPFSQRPVALVFGPENGAIAERLVWEAAREAHAKNYVHLYVIGFAIQPTARQLVESCDAVIGIPATYVQATPDLMMGDLLKNMRSSQIFSVCGLPEVAVRKAKAPAHETAQERRAADWHEVELLGLDVFDPATMQVDHRRGDDVPAWFLDTDYNGLSFHVCQAFFPRTAAWDSLKRALKGEYDDSVWQHLAGTVSVPFEPGQHGQIAVKVIDDRGNELMVVEALGKGK